MLNILRILVFFFSIMLILHPPVHASEDLEIEFNSTSELSNFKSYFNNGVVTIDQGNLVIAPTFSTMYPYLKLKDDGLLESDFEFETSIKIASTPYNYGFGVVLTDKDIPNMLSRPLGWDDVVFMVWPQQSGFGVVGLPCPEGVQCFYDSYKNQYGGSLNLDQWIKFRVIKTNKRIDLYINQDHHVIPDTNLSIKNIWIGSPEKTSNPVNRGSLAIEYLYLNKLNNFLHLKQYQLPWGTVEYDKASSWSNDGITIGDWGCALTSAVMVLNSYGYQVTPETLNQWLIQQPDGYIGNGHVNWLAISRYTKLFPVEDITAMEYMRYGENDFLTLSNTIAADKFGILGLGGHFVVATGSSGIDDYYISDPGYENRDTLSSYNNEFVSLGVYSPSQTDLSYLMFLSDQMLSYELTSDTGVKKVLPIFSEEIQKLNEASISSGVKYISYVPKPSEDNYRLEVVGNGKYQFQAFFYDINGDVSISSASGVLSKGDKDVYQIDRIISQKVVKETTYESLLDDIESGYDLGLIKSRILYTPLKSYITLSIKLNDMGKKDSAKRNLNYAIKQIKSKTPKYIDKEFSSYLLSEIEKLKLSL